jgi:hypothetical protein
MNEACRKTLVARKATTARKTALASRERSGWLSRSFRRARSRSRIVTRKITPKRVNYSSRSIKQDVGYYLHREGLNLGKHRVPRLLLPSTLDAQFGTPYPRSAGFDTDIGAFIESSAVTSKTGLMARLVIKDDITSGGALASGQTSGWAALS